MHPPLAIAATVWLVLVPAAASAVPASSAELANELPRVTDIRLGTHRSFDRVVLELESEAEVVVRETAPGAPLVIEIGARPLLPRQTLDSGLERTGRIEIERTPTGMRLLVEARPRRVRAFALVEPPRIVIDFASPGEDPFTPPKGTLTLEPPPEAPEAFAQLLEPVTDSSERAEAAPKAAPEPGAETVVEPPMPEEASTGELAPGAEPIDPGASERVEALVEAPTDDLAPGAELIDPGASEIVEAPEEALEPLGPPAPEPGPAAEIETEVAEARESPVSPAAAPAPPAVPEAAAAPPGRAWPDVPGGPLGLLVVGLGGVFAVLIVLGLLRRGRAREPDPELTRRVEYPGDTIAPAELKARAGDPVELLTKRLDEEVRLRFELEDRVAELREELKVLRDRARRLERAEREVE